jgi:methanogenic corrinoid protein MtbC1
VWWSVLRTTFEAIDVKEPDMGTDNHGLLETRLATTAIAVSGDSGRLYNVVSGLLGEGVPFESVLFDVLTPVEGEIGFRWQHGDYLVSEEHAATATVETVVSLLAGSFDQPETGQRVVVAVAEGDNHSLPGRLVAAHLLYLGYRTVFLGANVLASDLEEFLADDPPDALVLSAAMTTHLIGARASVRAAHAVGVPVVVGGRAFGEEGEWAAAVGADKWVADPRQVPDVLDTWQPDPGTAEAGAVDPSPELVALMEARPAVIAGAVEAFTTEATAGPGARALTETALLLGAVEASMLVDDDRVIEDMLVWQEATAPVHDYDASAIATALRSALTEISLPAATALARAMDRRP